MKSSISLKNPQKKLVDNKFVLKTKNKKMKKTIIIRMNSINLQKM